MHHIAHAYHECGDFPYRTEAPNTTYMLACSPRSGSTFLGLELWRTGLLGAPLEYLNLPHPSGIFDRLGGGDPVKYWSELQRRRSSPNGVFGFKMFFNDYARIAHVYPKILPLIQPDHVVFLVRKDKVAQAVSHAKATLSDAWFHENDVEPRPISYEFSLINEFYEEAVRQHRAWNSLFALTGCQPILIYYEDLAEGVQKTIAKITSKIGIPVDDIKSLDNILRINKQSDQINIKWKTRFIEDKWQKSPENHHDML